MKKAKEKKNWFRRHWIISSLMGLFIFIFIILPLLSFIISPESWRDDDKDGFSNYEEAQAGTDINNSDTDGDGVLDGEDYDPLDSSISSMPLEVELVENNENEEPVVSKEEQIEEEGQKSLENLLDVNSRASVEKYPDGKTYDDRILDEMDYGEYIKKMTYEDEELQILASSITEDCKDNECKIDAIYSYVVENYKYKSDFSYDEIVQSPHQTLVIKGGDCEDLTILTNSLLENIGITTYFVITELLYQGHMYGLACDVDTNNLAKYIKDNKGILSSKIKVNTYNINGTECIAYDPTANEYIGYESSRTNDVSKLAIYSKDRVYWLLE